MKRVIIICGPSGVGKTSLAKEIIAHHPDFKFAVSATTRKPRPGEVDGVDYKFLSTQEFKDRVRNGDFIEWKEVYHRQFYGSLKNQQGNNLIYDCDIHGARDLKEYYGNFAVSIILIPPSLEVLRERLEKRGTDYEESIKMRLDRAVEELKEALIFSDWDKVISNTNLDDTRKEVEEYVSGKLGWFDVPELYDIACLNYAFELAEEELIRDERIMKNQEYWKIVQRNYIKIKENNIKPPYDGI